MRVQLSASLHRAPPLRVVGPTTSFCRQPPRRSVTAITYVRGSARFGARGSPAAHGVRRRGAVSRSSHPGRRCRAGVRPCRAVRQRSLPVSEALAGRSDGPRRRDRPIRRHGACDHGVARRASRPRAARQDARRAGLLSDGRVIAGVGPGSSARDYEAIGVPYRRALAAVRRSHRGPAGAPARRASTGDPESLLDCRTRRSHRLHAGRGESHCGSEAGVRKQVCGASLASATDGSHPRTTRHPSASRSRGSRCRRTCTHAAGIPIASPTHWSRCGPGSPRTRATRTASCER